MQYTSTPVRTWPRWLLGLFISLWVTTSALAQISNFTAVKVEDGIDCNWPFSAMATNPVDGKIYALWRKGANENVTYKLIRWDGSNWTTLSTFTTANGTSSSIKVPDLSGGSDYVSLAIDATGRFHVAFKGGSASVGREAIWYGLSPTGTTWSFQSLQALPANSINQSLLDQVIEVDPQNQPHVAFLYTTAEPPRSYTLRYFRLVGGSWVGETAITQSGTTPGGTASNEIARFDLAVDKNAKAHFSFRRELNGTGRDGSLFYINNTSGSWSTPQELVAGNTAQAQGVTNTIDTDAANNVHIVHSDYQHKLYYTTNESGSFVTSQINGNVIGDVYSKHTLRINSKGDKFLVYNDNISSPTKLNYAYQLAGTSGSWTTGTAYTPTEAGNGGNYYSGLMSDDRRIMVLFDNSLTSTRGQCSEFRRDLWYATATVQAPAQVAPTVTTRAASEITTTGATLGGTVTADGGATVSGRGVVYSSTNANPAINGSGVTQDANGMNTGSFSETISGLAAGTTYYVRAYAINSAGTGYGSIISFTTPTTISSITRTGTTSTNASAVSYAVQFASSVSGLSVSNFSLTTTGGLTGANVASVSGSGSTYTVTVNTGTGSGTVVLNLNNTTGISPAVSNVPFTGQVYIIDHTPPTVTISSPAGANGGSTRNSPIPFTVIFSESVTGFVADDVVVTNGTVSSVTGTGNSYNLIVTPSANGAVEVNIGTSVAQDIASNGNTAASPFRIDYLPLTLTGFSALNSSVCTGSPLTLTATVSNADGLYAYTLTNGTSLVTGTGTAGMAFSRTITAAGSGLQSFTLVVTDASQRVSASQSVTVNTLPVVSITGLASAYCQDAQAVTLTGTPAGMGGSFTIDGTSASTLTPLSLTVGQHAVMYRFTDGNGCSSSASQNVIIKATPLVPSLLTQSGQSYPASQSAVTVDLNTGTITLVANGCAGTVNWTGPNNTAGKGTTIIVPTSQAGLFTYQASCTIDGCTGPLATATVRVVGRLTVLHRDVDNYADNNAIQPLIQIQNQGAGALPLSKLTLRYYLTVENAATLGNLSINYAQMGNQNVRLRYVPLNPVQQGASGYVEYSFTDGAGSLAAGANSGSIQTYLTRSDYGPLYEPDDYSYASVRDQLVGNVRITAYYDGVLISGVEPGSTTQIRAVRALTESKNGSSATQINTYLEVRNEGNVPINYSDLNVRYYFTSEGTSPLTIELDYTSLGAGAIQPQFVRLNTPLANADTYLELRFANGGQLAPGASTGLIRYRVIKSDYSYFNQDNDYSYQAQPENLSQNSRVVVYAGTERVWGQEPGASSRVALAETGSELSVTVLGNPVRDEQVSVEVRGAGSQPLQLRLLTPQGNVVSQQQVASPQSAERYQLSLGGQAGGLFLLQVSTPTQSQTVKVLKAN